MNPSTEGRRFVFLVAGLVVACEPKVESTRALPTAPQDAATSIAIAPVVADAGRVDPPAVAPSPSPPAAAVAPTLSGREWLVAHGVKLQSDTDGHEFDGCSEIAVGAPPRPALMCTGGPVMTGSLMTGESLFPLRIAVPEGRAMRSVLSVPLSAGPLDAVTLDMDQDPAYLRLEPAIDPAGTVIELREVPGQQSACADVLRPPARPASVPTPQMLIVMRAVCRAKGRYEWRGRAFVRVSP